MTRTRQASALALLAPALLLVLSFLPRPSFGQGTSTSPRPSGPTAVNLDYQQAGDSLRVIGRWYPRSDGAGAVDSVRFQWTVNGVVRAARTTRRLADTTMVLRALCPTSTQLVLTVTPFRRTDIGVPVTRATAAGCRILLPSIDSVVIDTGNVWLGAVRVDSTPRVHYGAAANRYLVTRADSTRIGVDVLYDRNHQLIGGRVELEACAPPTVVRWPIGDTTSVAVAQARAAQWATATLRAKAHSAFLAFDTRGWPLGAALQQACG